MEINALEVLYNNTDGKDWLWDSTTEGQIWNFTQTNPNPCDNWQGIQCSVVQNTCHVTSLILNNFNLQNHLSDAVGNLTFLIVLDLSDNYLRESIPTNIWNLTMLEQLKLAQNKFTNTIPDSIATTSKLQTILLSYNELNGTIPESLGYLTNLTDIQFDTNQFTGTIPSSLSLLSNVTTLSLYANYLHGTIPEGFCNLTSLRNLWLSTNKLTGTIPRSIARLKHMVWLAFSENLLVGSIPDDIGNMANSIYLQLNENLFTGTIPLSILKMTSLQNLRLDTNKLHGTIPKNIGDLVHLRILRMDKNALTGGIPSSVTKLNKVETFNFDQNYKLGGPIPEEIGNMTALTTLNIIRCNLTGTLPNSLTQLVALDTFNAFENKLEGTIPKQIGNMKSLRIFDLDSNQLTGTIPSSLTSIDLQDCYLFKNFLHGTIPEDIDNNQDLYELALYHNLLTGSIPASLVNIYSLKHVDLSTNDLTGTLPENMGDLENLADMVISNNQFTGTLPPSIKNLLLLKIFQLSTNYFDGSLEVFPENLQFLNIRDNCYSGDLSWLETLPKLVDLVFSNNSFSGTLPLSSQMSNALVYFQAQDNYLSGNIETAFDPSVQSSLTLIDLSKNFLVGSIPPFLFDFSELSLLLLAENCFTGTIPSTVCQRNDTLQALVLDGLHSAESCQERLFPAIHRINTLAPAHAVTGSIPSCLFGEMKKLDILHMSGNELTGTLPDSYSRLGGRMLSMSLSHNLLTGTIPLIFQEHGFQELDLSFNKLTGVLSDNINVTTYVNADESLLNLNNNRLSGGIPASLLDLPSIDLLAGNIFDCDSEDRENSLPRHDKEYDTYMCGSDETNNALIAYLVVFMSTSIFFAILLKLLTISEPGPVLKTFQSIFFKLKQLFGFVLVDYDVHNPSIEMESYYGKAICNHLFVLEKLLRNILTFCGVFICIFLLCNSVLGVYFTSYEYKYVWSVSIGYLSGTIPGVCLLLIVLAMIVLVFVDVSLVVPNKTNLGKSLASWIGMFYFGSGLSAFDKPQVLSRPNSVDQSSDVGGGGVLSSQLRWMLVMYLLFNIVVVMTVNASYVSLIISNISTLEQSILTVVMSLFKDGWRYLVMNTIRWRTMKDVEGVLGVDSTTKWLLIVCLFNNIVAPFIATAMVNTNCFYYALVPADNVKYFGEINLCLREYANYECALKDTISLSTSYQPTFVYTYQCTSDLLALFASVWIYMFLFGGILVPLFNLVVYVIEAANTKDATEFELKQINWFVLLLLKIKGTSQQIPRKKLSRFNYQKQVVVLCNHLAIILSFGFLFPPIAVVGCLAIVIQVYTQKVLVLDLVHTCREWITTHSNPDIGEASDEETSRATMTTTSKVFDILAQTEQACDKFAHTYLKTVCNIVLYVSLVWGLFLWDIVGDEVGLLQSMWVMLVLGFVGILLRLQDSIRFIILRNYVNSSASSSSSSRMISLTDFSSKFDVSSTDILETANPILVEEKTLV